MSFSNWGCCGGGAASCPCCVEALGVDDSILQDTDYLNWKSTLPVDCSVTETLGIQSSSSVDFSTESVIAGNSVLISSNEVQLTPDLNDQAGTLTMSQQHDWTNNFKISFEVNLGTNNDTNLNDGDPFGPDYNIGGADGIAFFFHNDPSGPNAIGDPGASMGAGGIQNGIAIEFDTFDNTVFGGVEGVNLPDNPQNGFSKKVDHTSIWLTGPNDPFAPLNGFVSQQIGGGEIETGEWYPVEVSWDVDTQVLTWTFAGETFSVKVDIPTVLGSNLGYFGWSSSTGLLRNDQRVRNVGLEIYDGTVDIKVECSLGECPIEIPTSNPISLYTCNALGQPYCNIDYSYLWTENSPDSCQKLQITSLSNVAQPFTVTANGNLLSTPYEVEQGRYGNVILEIQDANGCYLTEVLTSIVNISEDLWIEPSVLVTVNTNYVAGESGSGGNDQTNIASGVSSLTTSDQTGLELIQYLTSEIVRMRRGNVNDPNIVWLDDNGNPITFDPLCEPNIEYSLDVRSVGVLEADDTLYIFLEWYDSSNNLISETQIANLSDDFGDIVVTGVETPPLGATGVKVRYESVTNINTEWHYIYLRRNNTWIRAV